MPHPKKTSVTSPSPHPTRHGDDSSGFSNAVQGGHARPVQRHGIDRLSSVGDEKNRPAGNAKETVEVNKAHVAGDSGVAEARQSGPRGHDAGASGRQETHENSSPDGGKWPRQSTPCPTILPNPIDNTASQLNDALPKRTWDTRRGGSVRLPVTRGAGCVPFGRGKQNCSPGEKRFLDKNGLERLLFCAVCRLDMVVHLTESLCEEVST